jgi:glycine hydroxymethyltransferase
MGATEMQQIAAWMDAVAQAPADASLLARVRGEVTELTRRFPAPGL